MRYFRRIEWFRRSNDVVVPMKAEECIFPMDFGCSTTDTGGCQVSDACDVDTSTCSFLDECSLDYTGGCVLSDLCHTDGDGGICSSNDQSHCMRDSCSFDNGYCGMLDYTKPY